VGRTELKVEISGPPAARDRPVASPDVTVARPVVAPSEVRAADDQPVASPDVTVARPVIPSPDVTVAHPVIPSPDVTVARPVTLSPEVAAEPQPRSPMESAPQAPATGERPASGARPPSVKPLLPFIFGGLAAVAVIVLIIVLVIAGK
jgi:hypothetical protein